MGIIAIIMNPEEIRKILQSKIPASLDSHADELD